MNERTNERLVDADTTFTNLLFDSVSVSIALKILLLSIIAVRNFRAISKIPQGDITSDVYDDYDDPLTIPH